MPLGWCSYPRQPTSSAISVGDCGVSFSSGWHFTGKLQVNFFRPTTFIEPSQKQPSQLAAAFPACKVLVVEPSTEHLSREFGARLKFLNGSFGVHRFAAWIQHSRAEVCQRMLDGANIKQLGGFLGRPQLRQASASVMQEAGSLFRRVRHLKIPYIKGIDLREIGAASLFDANEGGFYLWFGHPSVQQHPPQCWAGFLTVNLGHQVHQELWLGAVTRRVAVDIEKADQAVNQVVNCRRDVSAAFIAASPPAQVEPVILVFLQRSRVEGADHTIRHSYCLDMIAFFPGS